MPKGGDALKWPEDWRDLSEYPIWAKRDIGRFKRNVECPDWLKPILRKRGRRLCSRVYDLLNQLRLRIRWLKSGFVKAGYGKTVGVDCPSRKQKTV